MERQKEGQYMSFLSGVLDNSNEFVAAIDKNFRFVALSKCYKEEAFSLLSIRLETGMSVEEAFSNRADELPNAISNWKRALEGEEFTIEWCPVDQNLERKKFIIKFKSIHNPEGEIIGATHLLQKEQLEGEKEPLHLEQKKEFELLANAMPGIVWTSGHNGRKEFFNEKAREYSGLSSEKLQLGEWKKFIHPEDIVKFNAQLREFKENGQPFEMEFRLLRKDNAYRWFMSRTVPLRLARSGTVSSFLGTATDIHEQKLLVEKLEQQAKELQQITEAIPQLVWTTEPNGRDSYFNRRWYEYTGLSMEESRTNGWLLALHPDDAQFIERQWEQSLITGEPFYNEYRCRKHDGSYRWFIARAVPLRDDKEKIIRWFGTCTDNHNQKLQRDDLNNKNQKLFQINNYLDEFVHAVAHDLRSPVAGLKLSFELLNQVEEPKKEKIMSGCQTYLERLDNTLQGLIQLIEVQEDPSVTQREVMDLRQMIDRVVRDLQEKLQSAGATIKFGDFQWHSVRYPKPYLYNILRNIFRYALRFKHPDQKLEFNVNSRRTQDGFLLIQIKENGPGLDLKKEMKNLFKPFSHINKGSDRQGMGLAIVKHMVEKNGGKIEVQSSRGEGTTFRIFLKEYGVKNE